MTESELADQRRFLNRLKILRSIDHHEVPEVLDWPAFRGNPPEVLHSMRRRRGRPHLGGAAGARTHVAEAMNCPFCGNAILWVSPNRWVCQTCGADEKVGT